MSSLTRARIESGPAGMAELSDCSGLSVLLRAKACAMPDQPAFLDQPHREVWSGRSASSWTFSSADEAATRLASSFTSLGLPAKAIVGVCLTNGAETPLVLAGIERAGLTACLLPVSWPRETLSAAIEELAIACVVTQSRIDTLRPAETWREIAAGYFGLRFIMSFGPSVPDGVIDLDRIISGQNPTSALEDHGADETDGGYISFDCGSGRPKPYFRTWNSIVASARVFLSAGRYEPGDRIISLLTQDDHRSLTTGLIAALYVGAGIEFHGLFSSAPLLESLASGPSARIVAPGWMEADLARLELGAAIRGIVLVHQAPVRFKARAPLTLGVVDALAFGEIALLAKPRNARGQFALSLDTPPGNDASQPQLLDVMRDEDGQILFRGLAAEAMEIDRAPSGGKTVGWHRSGYTADLFAGIVIGVS